MASIAPARPIHFVSALSGEGVDDWLDAVLGDTAPGGGHLAEVDYDRYANGEAVLGWLNARIELRWPNTSSSAPRWPTIATSILEHIGAACGALGAPIGHIKAWIETDDGAIGANLVSADQTPRSFTMGRCDAPTAALILNARVQVDPAMLESIVRNALVDGLIAPSDRVDPVSHAVHELHVLRPGRPVPTHRATRVVA